MMWEFKACEDKLNLIVVMFLRSDYQILAFKLFFRWGKRSFEDGLMRPARATPLRWGKRSTDSQLYELYNKRAPLRWGKRAPSRYVLFH